MNHEGFLIYDLLTFALSFANKLRARFYMSMNPLLILSSHKII